MKKSRDADPALRESVISSSSVASKSISFTPISSIPNIHPILQTGKITATSFMMDVPALLRGTGNGVCQICNRGAMELEKEKERVETEKEKEKSEGKEGVEEMKEAKNGSELNVKSEKSGVNVKVEVNQTKESNESNQESHSLKTETAIKTEEATSTSIPQMEVEAQQNASVGAAPSLATQSNQSLNETLNESLNQSLNQSLNESSNQASSQTVELESTLLAGLVTRRKPRKGRIFPQPTHRRPHSHSL